MVLKIPTDRVRRSGWMIEEAEQTVYDAFVWDRRPAAWTLKRQARNTFRYFYKKVKSTFVDEIGMGRVAYQGTPKDLHLDERGNRIGLNGNLSGNIYNTVGSIKAALTLTAHINVW